jgi:hypothetical protein
MPDEESYYHLLRDLIDDTRDYDEDPQYYLPSDLLDGNDDGKDNDAENGDDEK